MDKVNKIIIDGNEYGIGSSGSGLTDKAKTALLDVVASMPWVDVTDGQHKYDTLFTALYPPEELTLNNSTLTIATIGNTSQLVATATPLSEHYVITWESSDPTVASVNDSGLVTAISDGVATITAVCGSVSASCTVLSGAQPLYTLESCENFAWNDRYGNKPILLSINGNSIKIHADEINNTAYISGNLSSINTNGINGRAIATTWFAIPANSTIEFRIKNCKYWWSTNSKLYLGKVAETGMGTGVASCTLSGAERTSLNNNGYLTKTVTVSEAGNVNALVLDTTATSTENDFEFDLQIWINNVRYI